MNIQPQIVNLDTLFYRRLFRIPEYQRAYSWQTKHRQALFDDISRSQSSGNNRNHFMATVVGLRKETRTIVTDQYHVIDIVDGQQRITTLVLLYKAIAKALDRSDPMQRGIAEEIDKILVKPDDVCPVLLQTNHDASDFFSNYLRTGEYPQRSYAKTLAQRSIISAIVECETFVIEWQRRSLTLAGLVIHLKSRLTFILHEISDEALVYTVFEVLNSRGLEVSWFDRLKSMLMAVLFESETGNKEEMINEVHKLWSDVYRTIGLRLGLGSESLRFAATLRCEDCPNRPLNEEDSTKQLLALADGTPAGVIDVTNWIKQITATVDELTANRRINAVTKIAHARLVAVAIKLRSDLDQDQKERALGRWENVTFRIFGMNRRDARTGIGTYVRLAWRIKNDKLTFGNIMLGLSELGADYSIKESVKQLRATDCYNGWREELRYLFCAYEEHLSEHANQSFDNEQWNRIWEGNVSDSVEHIVPQSSGKRHVHWLGNLVLLPPGLNSRLGALSPSKKGDSYVKTGLLVAQQVGERITANKRWKEADIRSRENELLRWASSPTSATRGQNAHNPLISGSRKPKVGTTRPRAEGEDKGDSDADSRRGLGR